MAEPSQSGLSFFKKATPPQWNYIYSIYKEVLKLKAAQSTRKGGAEELIRLDNWYQEELPKLIKARKEPHITHEELVQITKWRLMRSKFRPRLLDLVKINSERVVIQLSKKALKKMPNFSSAIVALTNLKGVGPATASAVLAAGSPEHAPYMTEESMLSTPGLEGLDFTVETYMTYVNKIKECTGRLNSQDPEGQWNPHKVEQTLWTYYLVRFLKPALLEDMPKDEQGAEDTALHDEDSAPSPKKQKLETSDEDSNTKLEEEDYSNSQ
ncbi:hypothetical protein LAZ67_1001168 [Cordylochernes scorpioides]|uniref:Uncharacterized protein n=1 Tax=Cordylochernes scorpioides TaxID=51811 RepID=A0ABY6JV85_9ARAC|nr:hypothetical protein LAZ67_1001168 [Cordylochernes scorpioides]